METQVKNWCRILSMGLTPRLLVILRIGVALSLTLPGQWRSGWAQVPGPAPGLQDESGLRGDVSLPMIEKINELRRGLGLPLVRSCRSMMLAAKGHSEDMASKDELDHEGSDGSSFWERLCRSGYRPGCGPSAWVGEIIAAGNLGVVDTLDQWIQSPGHYQILVEPKARVVGVGYAKNPGAGLQHFWTVDFGAEADRSCQ